MRKLLEKKSGELGFGLFCGVGYFMAVLRLIIDNSSGSALLGFFFFPAIICGGALLVIKLTRSLREQERYAAINAFMAVNILVFICAAAVLVMSYL